MPIPSSMADLSTVAASNSPAGSESPISTDDFHRAIQAILRHTNAKGLDIASAATIDLGAATGEFVDITGTTTINALGTVSVGIRRTVRFTGALTLTHNAISLILPSFASIVTASGDMAEFISLGAGNWLCNNYLKQSGLTGSNSSSLIGHIDTATGAVATTVKNKLKKAKFSDIDFGLTGTGDETAKLTAFWNSAIANPGIYHFLENGLYSISAPLPDINVSNVKIVGAGTQHHSAGSVISGTVIKWIGATNTGTMCTISSVAGAVQRVSQIEFEGIGFDCNSLIATGCKVLSVMDCKVHAVVANATFAGVHLGVIAGSLSEAKDTQSNDFKFYLRQVEAPNATGILLNGDSVANVSLNKLHVTGLHMHVALARLENSDNNDWEFFRAYKPPTGTATESASLLGGVDAANKSRGERFHYYTANTPAHIYGTNTYASPSVSHSIFTLDVENATPVPIIDTGASCAYRKDLSDLADSPWVAFTSVVTPFSGAITAYTATGGYKRIGNICHYSVEIALTNKGTGAGGLIFTTPLGSLNKSTFVGVERAISGKALTGFLDGGGDTTVACRFYDATDPLVNGYIYVFSGFYQVV